MAQNNNQNLGGNNMKTKQKSTDKEYDVFGIRKLMIELWCKAHGMDPKGALKDRRMHFHKIHCMTYYGSLGYLFFALEGSPPKLYAVFKFGTPYNKKNGVAKVDLDINGEKNIEGITITDLESVPNRAIVNNDMASEIDDEELESTDSIFG